MAPNSSSPEWALLKGQVDVEPSEGRSAGEQAGFQMLALIVTLAFAIVGGLLVGLLLKVCSFLGQPSGQNLFEDNPNWQLPDEEDSGIVEHVINELDKRGRTIYKGGDQSFSPLLEDKGQNDDNVA